MLRVTLPAPRYDSDAASAQDTPPPPLSLEDKLQWQMIEHATAYPGALPHAPRSDDLWNFRAYKRICDVLVDRNPYYNDYRPVACPSWKKKDRVCPYGLACNYAHGLLEMFFHPNNYATEMCMLDAAQLSEDGFVQCGRPLCAFAHTTADLRSGVAEKKRTFSEYEVRLNHAISTAFRCEYIDRVCRGKLQGCVARKEYGAVEQLLNLPLAPPHARGFVHRGDDGYLCVVEQ